MTYPSLSLLLLIDGPPSDGFARMVNQIRPYVVHWAAFVFSGSSIAPYSQMLEGIPGAYGPRNRWRHDGDDRAMLALTPPHVDFGVLVYPDKPYAFDHLWNVNFPNADVAYVRQGSDEDVSWRAAFVRPGISLRHDEMETTPSRSLESLASRAFLTRVTLPVE